jgi:hypothetical protein
MKRDTPQLEPQGFAKRYEFRTGTKERIGNNFIIYPELCDSQIGPQIRDLDTNCVSESGFVKRC